MPLAIEGGVFFNGAAFVGVEDFEFGADLETGVDDLDAFLEEEEEDEEAGYLDPPPPPLDICDDEEVFFPDGE